MQYSIADIQQRFVIFIDHAIQIECWFIGCILIVFNITPIDISGFNLAKCICV